MPWVQAAKPLPRLVPEPSQVILAICQSRPVNRRGPTTRPTSASLTTILESGDRPITPPRHAPTRGRWHARRHVGFMSRCPAACTVGTSHPCLLQVELPPQADDVAGYSPNDVTVGAEKDWFGQGHVSFSTYLYNVTVNVTPSACCCAASSRLCSCLCSILRLFATACADNRLSFCSHYCTGRSLPATPVGYRDRKTREGAHELFLSRALATSSSFLALLL